MQRPYLPETRNAVTQTRNPFRLVAFGQQRRAQSSPEVNATTALTVLDPKAHADEPLGVFYIKYGESRPLTSPAGCSPRAEDVACTKGAKNNPFSGKPPSLPGRQSTAMNINSRFVRPIHSNSMTCSITCVRMWSSDAEIGRVMRIYTPPSARSLDAPGGR